MFKNYFLLSLKVLRRKPFYTFISLFGISFTLMILMLITSMLDSMLGANKPFTDRDKYVFMDYMERSLNEVDTIYVIDSIPMADGTTRYDTTSTNFDKNESTSTNGLNYKYIDKNLRNIEAAESYTFIAPDIVNDVYLDGRKLRLSSYYVDGNYWDVFDFTFLQGEPFTNEDNTAANKVAVITDKTAREYFGTADASVIGKEIELARQFFKVKGIVERPFNDDEHIGGDVFVPTMTIDARHITQAEWYGPFQVVFKARKPSGRELIKKELNFIAENTQMPPDAWWTKVRLVNGDFFEDFSGGIVMEEPTARAKRLLFIPIFLLLLLFTALPLINLVNLNVSRVFERKGEIGVRKAFGADGTDILWQFIFENLVLTFIGGVIGVLLAIVTINYVNENDLIGIARLSLSGMVFVYFFLLILLFGLLSGLLPALRMSRMNVADALR
jgi:putative ABC transport system permease protein